MRMWRLIASSGIGALLIAVTVIPVAADAHDKRDTNDKAYLALGDSVAFGFNPLLDPRNAANFVGYPEALASQLDLSVTNASCPGEASGGFISLTGVDNVCRPYRAAFPLHVQYSTSQLDFAVAFLRSNPRTRLITLDIGANDLFVLQKQCGGMVACIQQGLPGLLATLSANLATIYSRLNRAAPFHHQVVALTYYSINYSDPVGTGIIGAIDATVAAATMRAGGRVADGFGAFQAIAAASGGDSCAAGLLIVRPTGGCDIHPSPKGRDVLAGAIRVALAREVDND
jgi:lysophospholipase L1-like esterase